MPVLCATRQQINGQLYFCSLRSDHFGDCNFNRTKPAPLAVQGEASANPLMKEVAVCKKTKEIKGHHYRCSNLCAGHPGDCNFVELVSPYIREIACRDGMYRLRRNESWVATLVEQVGDSMLVSLLRYFERTCRPDLNGTVKEVAKDLRDWITNAAEDKDLLQRLTTALQEKQ